MTTPPETIAQLKRLLAEATRGRWRAEYHSAFNTNVFSGNARLASFDGDSKTEEDAAIAAAAVNALPSLLSDLEASQKRERVLREAGQRLLPYIPQILSPEPTCECEHYHAAKAFRAALAATEAAHA